MNMKIEDISLNPVEKTLKAYWETHPLRHLDCPCEKKNVIDVLESSFSRSPQNLYSFSEKIDEHTFISDDLDCAFVKHLRYTPAFWHKHDFFELLFVLDGTCTNTILSQEVCMQAGDICILSPDTLHAVSAFSDTALLLNILIRKSTFENAFIGLLEGNDILSDFFKRAFYHTTAIPYLLFHTGDDALLKQYVTEAYSEYNGKKRYKKQMLNALLSQFFITLFRNHEQNLDLPNLRLKTSEENLMYILRYMQEHYTTVSLKELADFFNYSERQLQRILQNATGMSFIQNIQKQKMTKAADLLTHSNLSIATISEQVGFASLNNFRKIFQKHYHMTPSEFRKRNPPL